MSARRSSAWGPVLLVLAGTGFAAVGCDTEAFCFVCSSPIDDAGSAGSGASDGVGGGGGQVITGGSSGGGTSGNGGLAGEGGLAGATNCDDKIDTQVDPLNCGECGHRCELFGAFPKCEKGVCVIDECSTNFKDLNDRDADGCEYACPVRPQTAELCNNEDDDCDSSIDEGISLKTVKNCGFCGNECSVNNGTPKCGVPSGSKNAKCLVDTCDESWVDKDQVPENGCEYKCPVFPAVDEVCDGLDQDCDGKVDEDSPGSGEACDGVCAGGVCQGQCTPGVTLCLGTGSFVCIAGDTTVGPSLDVCDTVDNDCDGNTDEGFDLDTDAANCGSCNTKCDDTLPNAISKCEGGDCVFDECESGFRDLDPNEPGCEYECPQYPPLTTEICNNIDDNCDGNIDEDLVAPTPDEFCRRTPGSPCEDATPVCCNDASTEDACDGVMGEWRCTYPDGVDVDDEGNIETNETKCDGIDNNCDGNVDEPWPTIGTTCTAGDGACSTPGSFECDPTDDTADPVCTAVNTPEDARDESCNGIDDNCDGQIDELTPTGTFTCYDGPGGLNPHTCKGWIDPMVDIGSVWMFKYEASHPDATLTDVGVADARACSNKGVQPWTSVTNAQAAAACEAILDGEGEPMRLCSQAEWQLGCEAGNAANPSLWSFTATPGTYTSGKCNDSNALLTGPWGTGNNAACAARWPGTKDIFDLSGNVSEWTSTPVSQSGKTYYRVRGGNYLSLEAATTCEFSFVLQRDTFRNVDLGFRCCADNDPTP